jgi:hypothetical protein
MARINVGRVLLGGLLAGLIVNISEALLNLYVVQADMNAAMLSLNRPVVGGQTIMTFVVLTFGLGIAAVWLYAAIRPRYGPGVKTAVCAGSFVWFFAYFFPNTGMGAMKLFPPGLIALMTLWGLGEIMVATIAGAWVYHD